MEKFTLENLEVFNIPMRQRLLEQAEIGLTHAVDLSDVAKDPEFDWERTNGYDPAHDRWHIRRVFSNAETLGSISGADMEIVWAAAAFHDEITYKKKGDLREIETEITADYIEDWLKNLNFPVQKIEAVKQAIRESSFYKTFQAPLNKRVKATSKEAEVVFDADKLDQGGALGIMRYCASSGRIGRKLFNPEDPACEHRAPLVNVYGLDLCKERSAELETILYTPAGRNIAKRRNGFLGIFFKQLKEELKQNHKGESQLVMSVFQKSGERGIQFYHPEDPFGNAALQAGTKRDLEPEKYALDALLDEKRPFVKDFIDELKLELLGK